MKNVTIKDIARELNVHHTTVSMALRNKKGIKKETRDKVWEKARELGYRPNLLAQGFRNKRTNTIGILVPNIQHHFFSKFISEITERANTSGYSVMVFQSNEKLEIEKQNIEALVDNRVAGVIASVSIETRTVKHFEILQKEGIPLVFFDRVPSDCPASCVTVNNYQGAFDAVSLMAHIGRKRIAFITGHSHINVYHERLLGYQAALKKHRLPLLDEFLIQGGFYMEDGIIGAQMLMRLSDRPDAILAVGDDVAIGTIKYLKSEGIRIPEDIAVIGFDNDPMGMAIDPELTTVEQPLSLMAEKVLMLLFSAINADQEPPKKEIIQCRILRRKSC